jgi:hypothetical protein
MRIFGPPGDGLLIVRSQLLAEMPAAELRDTLDRVHYRTRMSLGHATQA